VELIGLYLAACVLLVAAGIAKVIRPDDTARALISMVPASSPARMVPTLARMRSLVRVGAVAEGLLGLGAALFPQSVLAWFVALSYLAFALVIGRARARGQAIASCGCFGTPDTPATMIHVVANVGLAVAAGAVAMSPSTGSLVGVLQGQPLHGVPLVLASGLCAWLIYLAISVLAELQAARALTAITFGPESAS
jgi:hypothetical protein